MPKLKQFTGSFPKTNRAYADVLRGGRDLNNWPAVRHENGQEIAVITLGGHMVGEEPSPTDWARLFASAPDMLAALKALRHHIFRDDERDEGDLSREEFDQMLDDADAVIAKAEGRANG